MKAVAVVAFLALAAMGATYWRYQSLHPCDWMERDLVRSSDLPQVVVAMQIRAEFLLEGIASPNAYQCLLKWWELRRDGLPEQPAAQ